MKTRNILIISIGILILGVVFSLIVYDLRMERNQYKEAYEVLKETTDMMIEPCHRQFQVDLYKNVRLK